MFKQRNAGSTPNEQSSDQLEIKPLSIQLPDVHESMKLAGVRDVTPAPARPGKRVRLICCCGARGCGIGPMTGQEEE